MMPPTRSLSGGPWAASAPGGAGVFLANFAGAVVVMKMGTAVVTPEELRQAILADRVILA